MILSFSTKLNGKPTYFPEKIIAGPEGCLDLIPTSVVCPITCLFKSKGYKFSMKSFRNEIPKIHTIRADTKNRWKVGNKIHFVINNRSKKYLCFATSTVKSIQTIKIKWNKALPVDYVKIWVDGREFKTDTDFCSLIFNDGFNSRVEFFEYFKEDFDGKIIHWTDLKY